jgi:transcription antitermination protein NusB
MSFTGGDVTSSMSSRRKARKRALDVLYEADLRREPITDMLASYLERLPAPRPQQIDYTITLVEGVAAELDRVDELIASYAEGWTIDRMPVVDRNLARIAVYELIFQDEIDDAVAITEAVELAKTLSTEESPRFLNGVLGRIAEYATR